MNTLFLSLGIIIGIMLSAISVFISSKEKRQSIIQSLKKVTGDNQAKII